MNTKKILNIAGFALAVMGVLFKTNHWAGANIMIILSGITMLVTLFMFAVKDNKEAGVSDTLNYFMVGTLALFIVGAMFKIHHWAGARIFLYASYVLALVLPIALIAPKNDFKVSRQFIIIFFTFFILFLGLIRNNPIAQYFGVGMDNTKSATEIEMDNDSTKTAIDTENK